MKTITLRTLVRASRAVKRLTRAGEPVQVTDRGRPLWILQPVGDASPARSADDRAALDAELEALLAEPRRATPLSAFVRAARR
jgi:antitoxin (DNA-binding transcriptional repressor) of toxin-antitoxin stability system